MSWYVLPLSAFRPRQPPSTSERMTVPVSEVPAFGDAGGLVDGDNRDGVGDPAEEGSPDGDTAEGEADEEEGEADGVPEEHPASRAPKSRATASAPIVGYRATMRSMYRSERRPGLAQKRQARPKP